MAAAKRDDRRLNNAKVFPWSLVRRLPTRCAGRWIRRRRRCGIYFWRDRNRPYLRPALAIIGTSFYPRRPGLMSLKRGTAHNRSIVEYQRLCANWSKQTRRQPLPLRPCLALVVATHTSRCPFSRRRPYFVVQPQSAVFRMKQYRIPRWKPLLAFELHRSAPFARYSPRTPDCYIGSSLLGATKPSSHQFTIPQSNDGRGMALWKRSRTRFKNELALARLLCKREWRD